MARPNSAALLEVLPLAAASLKLKRAQAAIPTWQPLPHQVPPAGDWRTWAVVAGRGAGKTRAGAEWVLSRVRAGDRRIALVAPTAADARDVMVEGDSGILAIAGAGERPLYEPSKRRLTWPNGALATTYSADEPERLRGPQHDAAWADEIGAWRYATEAWDMLMLGLRLGTDPRVVATTTPRPTPLVRMLLDAPTTAVTRASTYANAANLAPQFLEQIIRRYEGTRLGRQEIAGELLTDVPGALWQRDRIDALRVVTAPDLTRVVVGVDPSGSSDGDEQGIVIAGVGVDGHGYVLGDASCALSPEGWARRAVEAFRLHRGDRIVAEKNYGGDMVASTIRTVDPRVPVKLVTASRGKALRAEPVAALYEQGRVHHVGALPVLEDQLTNWAPDGYDGSPDRLDALVWALTELMLGPSRRWGAV